MAPTPLQDKSLPTPLPTDFEKAALYPKHTSSHHHPNTDRAPSIQAYIVVGIITFFVCFTLIQRSFFPGAGLLRTDDEQEPLLGGQDHHIIKVGKLSPDLLPRRGKHGSNGRRLVIIGDVHGCLDELQALLKKINFHHSRDHLILAGDMIDKGPSSVDVIRLARTLHASAVRGNHEDNLLTAYASLPPLSSSPSFPSSRIEALAREFSKDDITWLASCPIILELGPIPGLKYIGNTVVVHAGLVPFVALENQDPFHVMHMRSISVDHRKRMHPSEDRNDGEPWWKVWNEAQAALPERGRTLVVYGHDSKSGLVEKEFSVGLDTGCVKGVHGEAEARLSALVIGGEEEWMRVESVRCGERV